MRQNLPVTQREHELPEDATLMSTTDVNSYIQYANAAFIEASGFDHDELIGQAHHLVRHPDMPPEAFADMWATLKAGMSWSALVKNRCKNGDHYWVRANATPVKRQGRLVGYMSVRTRPSRQEVQQAQELYARFRAGRQGDLKFWRGLVVHGGWMRWRSLLATASLRWRLLGAAGGLALLSLAGLLVAEAPLLACGGVLLGWGVMGVWLEHQVVRPVLAVLHQSQLVAAGEPGPVSAVNRMDEIGLLSRTVNQAGLNLRALLSDVALQIDGLGEVGRDIAQGNQNLSSRTLQAVANLEQTAAAMAAMSSSVTDTSETAGQACQMAEKASQMADGGGRVVRDVVDTMGEISASSHRIADIIGVIDGIAFQTNILALNAAVEAARAGDHGRGFAVVAGEVQGLAKRCAAAASEIKVLIGGSTERVEKGAELVQRAGQAIESIVHEATSVAKMIRDISQSTSHQSSGIGEMTSAMGELDRMTQQNAALVEQSRSAVDALRARAVSLREAVKAFH